MAEHNDLGKEGEKLAKKHLLIKGYRILATNWQWQKAEIDIIAQKEDVLAIVEVKTRRSNYFGKPEIFVTKAKQRNVIKAANAYLDEFEIDLEVRFDVISVLLNDTKHRVYHLEDAYYPLA